VIHGGELSHEAARDIDAFRREAAYESLPHSLAEAFENQALFSLRLAADALAHVAHKDLKAALRVAREVLELPLALEPFEGTLELLGAHLAKKLDDDELQARFKRRYDESIERFSRGRALLGLTDALADPYVASVLSEAFEKTISVQEDVAEPSIPHYPVLGSAFLPFSGSEASTRTYFVLVHKLIDPRVAAFAILKATLADITDGGDYGRVGDSGALYADLLLDFDEDPRELLGSLNLDKLALRLVFKSSDAFEAFSAHDGSLFDLEASPDERRLYFKLRVPQAWVAAQLPLSIVWPNVESCVLISEND
jgi:hypothetical protein